MIFFYFFENLTTMTSLKKMINILPFDLKNYIFRFISLTNFPKLGITLHSKLLESVKFESKLVNKETLQLSSLYIFDLTKNTIFKKAFIQKNNKLFIGKYKNNKRTDKKVFFYPYLPTLFKFNGYKEKFSKNKNI